MSNPYFRFKQFTVWHDRCAMKVGTDGVLLGAWAFRDWFNQEPSPTESIHILDIGTGTGLIALMMAQRCSHYSDFHIVGIDIDPASIQQAETNFAASPWSNHLRCEQVALQALHTGTFNLIVSNPPYFVDSLRNPDTARRTARHTDTLSYHELLDGIAARLSEHGLAALILPAETEHEVLSLAAERHLYPTRLTRVCSKPDCPPIRILLQLTPQSSFAAFDFPCSTLCIQSAQSPRSEEYAALTKDFYL
ncbi:MAG: methyltransferase [Bacteroidales bacterium]|nr:methyltransferase [Candidatus Colicola coprequi]